MLGGKTPRAGATDIDRKIDELHRGVTSALAGALAPGDEPGPIAECIVREFGRTSSLTRAVSQVFRSHHDVGRMFFGPVEWKFDDEFQCIAARDDEHALAIYVSESPHNLPAGIRFPTGAVVLSTDFRHYFFSRTDSNGHLGASFRSIETATACEEACFSGSVWASLFPRYFATLSRTVSCSFSPNIKSQLFGAEKSTNIVEVERAARLAMECFSSPGLKLLSLEEVRISLEAATQERLLQSEQINGAYVVRRYTAPRSVVFDYGRPTEAPSRGDVVTSYQIGDSEFHRDFVLWPSYESKDDNYLQLAAFNLLHMLAIRRTKLFRTGFASRVYNILLPPTLFSTEKSGDLLAIFPCVNFYRKAGGGFRRTISVTFIVAPLSRVSAVSERPRYQARQLTLRELHAIKRDLLAVHPDVSEKPARDQPPQPAYYRYTFGSGLPTMLKGILFEFCGRCLANGPTTESERDYIIKTTAFTSLQEAKVVTLGLVTSWRPPQGFHHPWERWLTEKDDPVFRSMVFRILFHEDFLDPSNADASRHAFRLDALNIGNTLGIDMAGMTLFNPQDGVKLVLFPESNERYPNHSLLRWMTWQVYIDSALTALRSMLYTFNPIIDNRDGLASVIGLIDDMLEEFVELYDLDIRDYAYKKEYQKLRELMGADTDYAQLSAKFAASKDAESLREQRLINKLVVSFTIATVTITVISTLAQIGKMDALTYVLSAIAMSTVFVWIGFMLFDPLRQGHTRGLAALKKAWTSVYGKD